MEKIFIFGVISTFYVIHITAKDCKYTLSDESQENYNKATLDYWQMLDDLTFNGLCEKQTIEFTCPPAKNTRTYDYNCTSDVVWNARFKIYSDRQDQVEHCLCDLLPEEGNANFNECMDDLRQLMLSDLKTKWKDTLTSEIQKSECAEKLIII